MTVPLIAAPLGAILAKSSGITLDPIAKPIAAVLAFFYALIPNFGIAIVLLTVAMMIVLTPLTIKQTRSMLVMQKLQPELKRLQEQHKNDRQALNEAVMALYREHNASPLGGCLPMLLPLPIFFALFRVLEGLSRTTTVHGKRVSDPKYLSHSTQMYKDIVAAGGQLNAFGMNLAKSAANVGGTFWHKLPYFILLLLSVGTQYYQQRQITARNPQAAQGQQQAIMKFFPIIFGFISIRFPAGVVLYWTTSNLIRIFQQWAMYRWDPKVKALVAQDVREVEAKTREIDEREQKNAPKRPRLRDLLSNAMEANTGKGDTKPPPKKPGTGGRPNTGRPSATGRPSGTGRQSGTGKPSGSGKPPGTGRPSRSGRPSSTGRPAASGKPQAGQRPSGGKGSTSGSGKAPSQPRPASDTTGSSTAAQAGSGQPGGDKSITSSGNQAPPGKVAPGRPNGSADDGADAIIPLAPVGADEGEDMTPSGAGTPDVGTPGVPSADAPSPEAASGSQQPSGQTPNGSRAGRTGAGSARSRNKRARAGTLGMEWVETTGRSIEEAKDAALDRLGVDESEAEFEVVDEPRFGLFGRLRSEARIRARVRPTAPRPKQDRRDRRRRRRGDATDGTAVATSSADEAGDEGDEGLSATPGGPSESSPSAEPAAASGPGRASPTTDSRRRPVAPATTSQMTSGRESTSSHRSSPRVASDQQNGVRAGDGTDAGRVEASKTAGGAGDQGGDGGTAMDVSLGEQADVGRQFLDGLVEEMDLDAEIHINHLDEDTVEIRVDGKDLGLLIGAKGATLVALQDLTRTVVQRRTGAANGRLLVDVSGYRQKRKEALERFARQLAEEVKSRGTRKVLEPMSAVDRKIVHDTVNAMDGVTTTSEGEEPRRRVIILASPR